MVPYIPPEVMIEILVKCPVKTLLKFKVVCESWRFLILSHEFVRRHLSSFAGNTQRIILSNFDVLYDLKFYSVNDSMVLDETPIGQIGDRRFLIMMGSCDGLICLKEVFSRDMFLWNPCTRDSKKLPSTSEVGVVHDAKTYKEWRYGFCYDCNSDDYKVLALVPKQSVHKNDDNRTYKSIMYTLRTNSWRRIQGPPPGYYFFDKASAFVSGALHWTAGVRRPYIALNSGCSIVIVSFDLTSETYRKLPLPQVVGVSSILHEVESSKGFLCLLADTNDGNHGIYGNYDIWVMKEYGVPESWTKAVKIPRMLDGIFNIKMIPVTWLVENGEILLNLSGKLASYNPDKNSVRYYATNGEVRVRYPSCVGYKESPVSPNCNLAAD